MDDRILQEAVRWHEASARDDCDWEAFTRWLEADPAHQSAYDDVALLGEAVTRHGPELRAAFEAERRTPRRRGTFVALAAAAAVAGLAVLLVSRTALLPGVGSPEWQQATAEARTLSLQGGGSVVLAPDSRLRVSGRQGDHLELVGAAYFDVPHDPARTLVVKAGPYTIRDIGTRFDVLAGGRELRLSVAEGSVDVALPGSATPERVTAGQRLRVSGDPLVAGYASIDAGEVGSWREGRLVFHDEPLSLVVQEIARHTGTAVSVAPEIAGRRFSGVLTTGEGAEPVARLQEILDLAATRSGDGVHLSARDAAR